MALEGLGGEALAHLCKANLYGAVTVVLHGFLLNHGAGACFYDSYRDHGTVSEEYLRHTDLFAY
jgi:hypothetical protein